MEYKDIEKAVKEMQTVDIKGKAYPMVQEKVKAFKKVYPNGAIITEIVTADKDACTMRATAYDGDKVIATGYAREEKMASFINKTSYVENCETSAVGRALSFAGFGGDASIASAEEVANAIENQDKGHVDTKTANGIYARCKKDGIDIEKFCKTYGFKDLNSMTAKEAEYLIANWTTEVIPKCKA